MDTATRSAGAQAAIGAGMTPNEVRFRFFDLGPVKGGDSPMLQQQYYSLSALAERDQNDPFAKPEPAPPPQLPPAKDDDDAEDFAKHFSVALGQKAIEAQLVTT
jgi:hypothetical protein